PSTHPATAPTTTRPAAPPPPAGPVLTGFGATAADWRAHDVADPDFPESYDRDTSMTRVGNYPGARFITVTIADRVVRYQRNLRDGGVPESEAIATVKADLPPDVAEVWHQAKDGNCLQVEYRSAALASVWADVDPQGGIQVEFHAVDAGGAYD